MRLNTFLWLLDVILLMYLCLLALSTRTYAMYIRVNTKTVKTILRVLLGFTAKLKSRLINLSIAIGTLNTMFLPMNLKVHINIFLQESSI